VLIEWKGRVHVALINNSALTRNELLEEICLRLGFSLPGSSTKPQVLSQLERHLLAVHARGERAILLLDEAQNLDRELLEEIRLLSNLELDGEKLLQVFLVGQPELEARLARPELRQLRQRISVHYRLKPLSFEDSVRYIHHRVSVAGGRAPDIFPADTCRLIYALSHGIPREINHICAQALLGAYVDDAHVVRPEHVQAAAAEIEFLSVIPESGEAAPAPQAPEPTARIAPRTLPPMPLASPPEPRIEHAVSLAPVAPTRPIEPPPPAPAPPVAAALPPAAPEPPRAAESAPRPTPPLSVVERDPAREPASEPRPITRPSPSNVEEMEEGDGSGTALKWLLGAGAVAVIVIAGVLLMRFGPWSGKPRSAAVEPPVAPAETSAVPRAAQATVPQPPEPFVKAPVENTPVPSGPIVTAAAATPAPKKIAPAVVPPTAKMPVAADAAHAPNVAPPRIFGIAVASFLDQGRAEAERGRLEASTKMPARVQTIMADSVLRFELVLGSFASQDAAERAASDLIVRGLVDEARVVAQAQPPAPSRALR